MHVESEQSTYREAVSAEVRALMARRRVTQADLAKVIGTDQSGVSRRLRGKTPFDMDDVFALARYFDVSLSKLLPEPASVAPTQGTPTKVDSLLGAGAPENVRYLFPPMEPPALLASGQ